MIDMGYFVVFGRLNKGEREREREKDEIVISLRFRLESALLRSTLDVETQWLNLFRSRTHLL